MTRVVCCIIAWLVWMTPGVQASDVGDARQGLRLARQVCAECHLVANEAGRPGKPNAPSFEAVANTPGMTRAALAVALQTSHRTMPNLVVKGDDADDISAYILSLKKRGRP